MNTFILSEFGLPTRIPPRPLELRQSNYLELYDFDTLFYDVCYSKGRLLFLSPPLADDVWAKVIDNILVNDEYLHSKEFQLYKSNKVHKLILFEKEIPKVKLFNNEIKNLYLDKIDFSKYKKVLFTKQKNNDILWIKDWIKWHVKHHKIDAVIIYDNSSDAYTLEELSNGIQKLDCASVVVNMPFIFGPGAYETSSWDSDYFQYFALEHARYVYCADDAMLLHVDIDELVISSSGLPVFNELVEGKSIVFFQGKWVEVENKPTNEKVAHKSHNLLEIDSRYANKWVANLKNIPDSVFLRVHDKSGELNSVSNSINSMFLHFRSITTNWKLDRARKVNFDSELHERIDISNYSSLYKKIRFLKVSLIICTYNRSDILKKTLPYLIDLTIPESIRLEIIIVNNNSDDDTDDVAEKFISFINRSGKSIKSKYVFEQSQGLSFARNKGYSEASGDYIAYIDDECVLPPEWLIEASKIIEKEKPAFLGGPYLGKYMSSSASHWFKESFGDSYILKYNLPDGPLNHRKRSLSGGNMFIRRDVFEKIGLFDVNLGMSGNIVNYGEEVEFQRRFIAAYPDEVIWYDSKVFLWHLIRDEKMKMSFLLEDAFIRGKSAAELKKLPKRKLLLAPLYLIFFSVKAVLSAFKNGVLSIVTRQHYFLLLYSDYKNGTWRDVGAAWYKTKKLLGL